MSKINSVEKSVSPKASSCSMILRSACSHGHKNCTVKEHLIASHRRRHNSSISSKNQYSSLNGQFYETIEVHHKANQRVLQVSSLNVSCAKELHFSQFSLSDSQDSYIFNNSNHKECSSDYFSAAESDINVSLDSTSNMNTRSHARSSHPSVRSLSDSEGESDITVHRISRLTRKSVSSKVDTNQKSVSQRETNKLSRNNVSYMGNHSYSAYAQSDLYTGTSHEESVHSHLTDSSNLDTSFAEYSLFNRIRLFFWKSSYLNLLKYMRNDLWVLSRISKLIKGNPFPFLLLPFILFLVLGAFRNSSSLHEPFTSATDTVSTVFSSFFSFLSSMWSSINIFSSQKTAEVSAGDSGFLSFLPNLSAFGAFFSGWLRNPKVETEYDLKKCSHNLEEDIHLQKLDLAYKFSQTGAEELLAVNKLKDDLKELKSSIQRTEADKEMYQKFHTVLGDLQFKYEALSKTVDAKEKDSIEKYQKEKSDANEKILAVTNEYKSHIDVLKNKLKILESKLAAYEDLKKCCDKQWHQEDLVSLIEKNIIFAFKEVLDGNGNSKFKFFNDWLSSKFFNHEKLVQEINAALRKQSSYTEAEVDFSKVLQVVESTVLKHVDALKKNLSEFNTYSFSTYSQDYFSEDKIRKIVKEAIMIYDADKTGQVDYALESGGGSVLGTRCSETYVDKYGKISLFGLSIWTQSNSPRTAIQPDVQPGRCWAFKGSQGYLVLQLSATIYPTGFTLEHIPISLSPAGSIDSAPKNFSVWGLDSEKDSNGKLLGEYFYDINGDPLQYFEAKIPSKKPYSYIELQIHSNHGNMDYTCLYRFRVHGKRA